MEFELPETEETSTPSQGNSDSTPSTPGDRTMPVIKVENFQSFQDIVVKEENVLVKFEADWCMPCKAMSSVVEEIANQHPNVKVVAVDIETDGMDDLLTEYNVRSVPTFVRLRKGTKVNSAVGTVSKAELSSLITE
jgi:thioredoxin 1